MKDTLVVFARLPVPGRTKTRLAASVGPDAAAAFYRACAEHVIQRCLEYVAEVLHCTRELLFCMRSIGRRPRTCLPHNAVALPELVLGLPVTAASAN